MLCTIKGLKPDAKRKEKKPSNASVTIKNRPLKLIVFTYSSFLSVKSIPNATIKDSFDLKIVSFPSSGDWFIDTPQQPLSVHPLND